MNRAEFLKELNSSEFTGDNLYEGFDSGIQDYMSESNISDFDWESAEEQYMKRFEKFGPYKVIEAKRTNDHYGYVLHFTDFDYIVKSDGYYASHSGASDFNDWYFVVKKTKTIEFYAPE